jgi:hypothetical protein
MIKNRNHTLKPHIAELLKLQLPFIAQEKIEDISEIWEQDNKYFALKEIEAIEKKWGPIGIWSAKYVSHRFLFAYPKKYDCFYRPLKYVYIRLFTSAPQIPGVTRDIVLKSTMHVEGCLKIFCWKKGLKNYEKKWIVPLVKLCGTFLEDNLKKSLILLGNEVSNVAKHKYDVGTNEPLFGSSDALVTYLCCRKLGYELLVLCGELPNVIEACETGPFLSVDMLI